MSEQGYIQDRFDCVRGDDVSVNAACVDAPRRELWIGLSTLKVILGNMSLPAFLDRYLAHVAFNGQKAHQPVSPERKDNLVTPVTSLHRTRGSFSSEAKTRAISTGGPIARMVPLLAGGITLFLGGMLAAEWRSRRLERPRYSRHSTHYRRSN
jgi:hypothetical protein